MSEAFECDRCECLAPGMPEKIVWCHSLSEDGNSYEEIRTSRESLHFGHGGAELCTDCAKAYDSFLTNGGSLSVFSHAADAEDR